MNYRVSMVPRTAATTLLVCGPGFVPLPSAALAIDTRIRQVALPCVGDCDNNSKVTVDEIVTGLTIALGSASLGQCPRFDCDGTGRVRVDCIIRAIDAALNGCDPGPTPSRTRVGLCGACTTVNQCHGGLSCFSCSRNCTGNTRRCSLADTFVTCEDGVF